MIDLMDMVHSINDLSLEYLGVRNQRCRKHAGIVRLPLARMGPLQ
jgi:hypothetical protein